MRLPNTDIAAKTISHLSEELECELQCLIVAIKPFAYHRSEVSQGNLGLVLARAERASQTLKSLCTEQCIKANTDLAGEKLAKNKDAFTLDDVDYTYLVAQIEEAECLFAQAHRLLRKPLAVARVEGNVVHLCADNDAADIAHIDCMLKALELEHLLNDSGTTDQITREPSTDKPFLRLV